MAPPPSKTGCRLATGYAGYAARYTGYVAGYAGYQHVIGGISRQ